jgi:ATP-dependent exoDNAse (exonuclease V) beta subunit
VVAGNAYSKGRDRYYTVEGSEVDLPSVTTYLAAVAKPALTQWSAKVERALVAEIAKELHGRPALAGLPDSFESVLDARLKQTKYACNTKLADAGEIGTALHERIEWELKFRMAGGAASGEAPVIAQEAQWAFDAWLKWQAESNLEPLMIEQQVYSIKYGFAGTTDIIGRVNGMLVVGDWKTGSTGKPYLEHMLQVSAYREALKEMGHFTDEVMGGVIVNLPKKAGNKGFKASVLTPEEMDDYFKTFLCVRGLWVAMKKFEKDKRYR